MAKPELDVERRLDNLEAAVETMANWLVQAQTGFGAHDAQGIIKILREGEMKESE